MRLFVGLMTVGVVLGLFATKSLLYAGETGQVKTAAQQMQVEDAELQAQFEAVKLQAQAVEDGVALADWQFDFSEFLDKDEQYVAASAAVDAYEGDDDVEYARLESVRDEVYNEIARYTYEERFGRWEGSDDEFSALLAAVDPQPVRIRVCVKGAIEACGQGKVKTVKVTADGECSFTCATATAIQ